MSQRLNRSFERGVFLTNDLVQRGGPHPGFLELLKGTTRFHSLVLAGVADKKYTIMWPEVP